MPDPSAEPRGRETIGRRVLRETPAPLACRQLRADRLHYLAVGLRQCRRPGRFVARFGQHMAEFDHLTRLKVDDVDPEPVQGTDAASATALSIEEIKVLLLSGVRPPLI